MAGLTHCAFRRLLSDFGGYGGLFTEMLAARKILKEDVLHSPWLKRRPQEGKVIYQLFVTNTDYLPEILARLSTIEPHGLDLNSGCPSPGIRRQGGGARLLTNDGMLRDIVRVMRKNFAGPLTVKLRLGPQTDDWRERIREQLHVLEEEGVDAVTLHPRFTEETRSRDARHGLYAEFVDQTRLPIIASGDITGPDFLRSREQEFKGVAGLMIGRMAVIQPWIFAQWRDPGFTIQPVEVWNRLCDYIAEDFPPQQALSRIKFFTPYLARNFMFGHTLFKTVGSAPDFATARSRGEQFLQQSPERLQNISLAGL